MCINALFNREIFTSSSNVITEYKLSAGQIKGQKVIVSQ
jgi:hypothetical protein